MEPRHPVANKAPRETLPLDIFHHAKIETPPQIQEHLTTHELHCRSRTTHSPCTSTNPTADFPRQHNADNDPSIKFLVATSTTQG